MTPEELRKKLRAINAANAAYWADPTAHVLVAVRAFKEVANAPRSRGGKRTAAKRRAANVERDRLINDYAAAYLSPDQIAGMLDDEPSVSQIRRILQRARP
jgi:hypothetical protein